MPDSIRADSRWIEVIDPSSPMTGPAVPELWVIAAVIGLAFAAIATWWFWPGRRAWRTMRRRARRADNDSERKAVCRELSQLLCLSHRVARLDAVAVPAHAAATWPEFRSRLMLWGYGAVAPGHDELERLVRDARAYNRGAA